MIDEKLKPLTSADELKPGLVAESRARVVVSLARARLQLGIEHHLADTGIVKVLMLIDELDNSLTQSASRLRACYSIHFPEVCRPHFKNQICLNDTNLVQLIANSPLRSSIISSFAAGSFTYFGSDKLASLIATAAQDSVGAELSEGDCENLQKYAQRLLQMNEVCIVSFFIYLNKTVQQKTLKVEKQTRFLVTYFCSCLHLFVS